MASLPSIPAHGAYLIDRAPTKSVPSKVIGRTYPILAKLTDSTHQASNGLSTTTNKCLPLNRAANTLTRRKLASSPQTHTHTRTHKRASSSILPNKRDKRQIKHSLLLSRLKLTSSPSAGITKNARKRQRQRREKHLVSSLGELADALPDPDPDPDENIDIGRGSPELAHIKISGKSGSGQTATNPKVQTQTHKMHKMHKQAQSLNRKHGYTRRVQKLSALERQRFERNLRAMAAPYSTISSVVPNTAAVWSGTAAVGTGDVHTTQWAALRAQITQALDSG